MDRAATPPFSSTSGALLLARAMADPDHVVLNTDGQTITAAELADRAKAAAIRLNQSGIHPGNHVLTMLRNDPDHVALFLGISLMGAIWVPLDPRARGPGLEHAAKLSRPSLAIVEAEAKNQLAAAGLAEHCPTLVRDEWFDDTVNIPHDWSPAQTNPDDVRAILFTSGTTGPPKGVMVSERMLLASAAGTALASNCSDNDVYLMWEPLHHIGGSQIVIMALIHHIRLVMVERFSASRFWHQVQQHRINKLHYLGGILEILLRAEPRPDDKKHGIELAFGGGCRPEIWQAFETRFGIPIREVYGMTEASSFTTINLTGAIGNVGSEVPWFAVDLIDRKDRPVGNGEIGEIVVSTEFPGLFTPGYYNAGDATAKLLRGQRLHTGDLGRRDAQGNLEFMGRMTDSLRRRGENISAWEIETALAGHSDIAETAVVGVPATIGEHDILCFVILRHGAAFDPEALASWCRANMSPNQVPRYWKEMERFERTPSQRIRKELLVRNLDDASDTDDIRGR